ncbi:hypothetical protein V5R04_15590 [Jonesiaceae bacterium BS-20]|uniref:Uncharacterized protein n=1 Tax=Jonesiaceae bacterium BS-20 TaxID=3120821 RepID=A0AAU7DUV7_9MICO
MSEFGDFLAHPADLAVKTGTPATDPRLLLALQRAGDRFEGKISYKINLVTDDVVLLSGDGSRHLFLPARPVVGTPTVKIAGTPTTAFEVARNNSILRHATGWPDGLDNIEVTFSHGWEIPPADIQDAVLEQAETIFLVTVGIQSRTAGSESITTSALAAIGVTQKWTDAVEKYALYGGDT